MRIVPVFLIFLFFTLVVTSVSHGQPWGRGHGMYRGAPYGHFCPGRRWGPYGVRQPVRTVDEARQVLNLYLSSHNQDLHAGKVDERGSYFVAEITDLDGNVIDTAIIDKRTGRIRSIY